MINGKYNILMLMCLLLTCAFYMSACQDSVNPSLEESVAPYLELEAIDGASNTNITVNRGDAHGLDSYFAFDLSNIETNGLIREGVIEGWCLEWNKPIRQNNDVHQGVELYNTFGSDTWKAPNYLMNIKKELKDNDPDLTYKEIQVALWSLIDEPAFNIDKVLQDGRMPSRMMTNGQPNFDVDKTKEIVNRVRNEVKGFDYKPGGPVIVFSRTEDDQQNVGGVTGERIIVTEADLGPSERPAGFPDSHTVPEEDWFTPTHGGDPLNTTNATYGFESGPNNAGTLGEGSFLFDVPAGERSWILTDKYGTGEWHGAPDAKTGTRLDEITTLMYSTYISENYPGGGVQTASVVPSMQIMAQDQNGTFLPLIFDPPSGSAATGEWQEWDTINQAGWRTESSAPCSFPDGSSWSTVLSACPDAKVLWAIGVAAGTWPGQDFHGYTDLLKIGVNGDVKTYDFEPLVLGL